MGFWTAEGLLRNCEADQLVPFAWKLLFNFSRTWTSSQGRSRSSQTEPNTVGTTL